MSSTENRLSSKYYNFMHIANTIFMVPLEIVQYKNVSSCFLLTCKQQKPTGSHYFTHLISYNWCQTIAQVKKLASFEHVQVTQCAKRYQFETQLQKVDMLTKPHTQLKN